MGVGVGVTANPTQGQLAAGVVSITTVLGLLSSSSILVSTLFQFLHSVHSVSAQFRFTRKQSF